MTKINLNANAMAKLLEKNSTRKSASEELRKLRMQTEGGMIWIDIDTDNKLLICKLKTGEKKPKFEKIGTKWPRIEKIILDFNLRQAGHLFDFEAFLL